MSKRRKPAFDALEVRELLSTAPVASTDPGLGVVDDTGSYEFGARTMSATASFVGTDTTTHGAWKGVYGNEGYDLANDGLTTPSYVSSLVLTGTNVHVWEASSTDTRAPQKAPAGSTDRVAAAWFSSTTMSLAVNMADSAAHTLTVYAFDYDWTTRSQKVELLDTASGAVLDTRTLNSFHDGIYLRWTVTGSVTVRVTNLNPGLNAVISGLFLGADSATTPSAASYTATDAATAGNWPGAFGAEGHDLAGDTTSPNPVLPGYVSSLTLAGVGGPAVWASSTTDTRALKKSDGSGDRLAEAWYTFASMDFDIRMSDAAAHSISLYAVDYDSTARSQRIDLIDDATGNVLDTRTLSSFHNGVYLTWNVTGKVTIRVTNLVPNLNAVVGGLFFGTVSDPGSPLFDQAKADWQSKMLTYGAPAANKLHTDTGDQALSDTYYDSARVFRQIYDYTGNSSWLTAVNDSLRIYRDGWVLPNNGVVPGYWNFTQGMLLDYQRTGTAASKTAITELATSMYGGDSVNPNDTVSFELSREVAYSLMANLDAEKAGNAHRSRTDLLANQALGHLDQWTVSQSAAYVKAFMVGLTCEALIEYQQVRGDTRVLPAIRTALNWLWDHEWVASARAFMYANAPTNDDPVGTGPAPDLNLLIAPAYAWVYRQTGDTTARDRGDQIFAGGVDQAYLVGAKQFNQSYRWSFAYVSWRTGT